MKKPQSRADLIPAFDRIGVGNWEHEVRATLADYEVPLPTPVRGTELQVCEKKLGLVLPEPLSLLLTTLGPLDLDGIKFYAPERIERMSELSWSRELSPEDRRHVKALVTIGQYADDSPLGCDTASGRCCRCELNPPTLTAPTLTAWINSVDDLLKIGLIDLCSSGAYGWDDDYLEDMAAGVKLELFGGDF